MVRDMIGAQVRPNASTCCITAVACWPVVSSAGQVWLLINMLMSIARLPSELYAWVCYKPQLNGPTPMLTSCSSRRPPGCAKFIWHPVMHSTQ